MRISDRGIQLIKHFEGVRYRPYRCAAGLYTVGVGHLIGDGKSLPTEWNRTFTEDEVNALLRSDIARFELGVSRMLSQVRVKQCVFDVCVSFSFNHGLGLFQRSTFRQEIIRGNEKGAVDSLLKYCKARVNGVLKEVRGLKLRREAEAKMFLANY